jgi:uncharacterized membrane protein
MKQYVAVGLAVLAGAALLEAALVPGLVIGGAALLAPKALPALRNGLRNGLRPPTGSAARRRAAPVASPMQGRRSDVPLALARFGIGRAVAKTVTFRIIVTTLDFTTNYVVIGELSTAAGLSTFNLVVGPLFYLAHETTWNYFGPAGDNLALSTSGLRPAPEPSSADGDGRGLVVSRALAKTITFRTIATVMDFTTNYVVVRDVVTAAGLSAFAFFVGPFVYLGHEKLWDHYVPPQPGEAADAQQSATVPA